MKYGNVLESVKANKLKCRYKFWKCTVTANKQAVNGQLIRIGTVNIIYRNKQHRNYSALPNSQND